MKLEAIILGEDWYLTEEEFEAAKGFLGEPTRCLSNCCNVEIEEPIIDHTARCPKCYEGCEVIYIWENEEMGLPEDNFNKTKK